MNIVTTIKDQFRHMEWADALVWQAVMASDVAQSDETIRARLHHTHLVQRSFLAVWKGELVKPEDSNETQRVMMEWFKFGSDLRGAELMAWAQEYHRGASQYLTGISETVLDQAVVLPWADFVAARTGKKPEAPTLGETLFQVTAHSAYHRGQINTRLRELGAEPPFVDFIAWLWLARPVAQWQTSESE